MLFPEKHNRYRQLVFRAYAEELITIAQAAEFLTCTVDQARRQLDATT